MLCWELTLYYYCHNMLRYTFSHCLCHLAKCLQELTLKVLTEMINHLILC